MSKYSPSWAADYAERTAEAFYRRERSLNAFIESKNPHLKPTARYLAGPRPAVEFHTRKAYLNHLARYEMSKYNPHICS